MTRPVLVVAIIALAMIGSMIVPLAFGGRAALLNLATVPVTDVATIITIVVACWLAKAMKFWLLARRLSQSASFAESLVVSLACDFAFVATPGGLGGYPATVFLAGRAGIAPACAAAIAAADQVLDLLFFAAAVPLALLWMLASRAAITPGIDASTLLQVAIVIAAFALLIRRVTAERWLALARSILRLPLLRRHREALIQLCEQVMEHLRDLRTGSPRFAIGVLSTTVVQWVARYAILWLSLAWAGFPVPFGTVFLIQALALHAGQWTGVPGGVGGTDIIIAQSLSTWAPAEAIGGALMTWRLATFHLTLLGGGLAFALLAARRSRADQGSARVGNAPAEAMAIAQGD